MTELGEGSRAVFFVHHLPKEDEIYIHSKERSKSMTRKKWVYIVLLMLVLPVLVYSFDIHPGLKAGICFPYAGGQGWDEALVLPSEDSKIVTFGFPGGIPPIKVCLTGGVFVTLGLMPWFAIQPELLYTMLAQSWENSDEEGYIHWAVIEVPVLAKLRLVADNGACVALFAGPDVMYVLAEQLVRDDKTTPELDKNAEIVWNTGDLLSAPVAFGAVAGLAFHFPNGFFIEGRYFISFFKADEDYDWAGLTAGSFDPSDRAWNQNNIQAMIGYQF